MKIFEFQFEDNKKDWVCATDFLSALKTHNSFTDVSVYYDDFEVVEVPESEWAKYPINMDGDANIKTFADFMVGQVEEEVFCSTEFESSEGVEDFEGE